MQKNTDRDSIDYYLRQISRSAPLTRDQEGDLSALIALGDQEACRKLVLANLRFVVSAACSYLNQGLPLMDLVNAGNIGLINAARKFNGRKNFRFISYAVWWIRQAILKELAEQSRIFRLPLDCANYLYKIESAKATIRNRHHHEAGSAEISALLGISIGEVDRLQQVSASPISLDAPIEDGQITLHDILPGDEPGDDQPYGNGLSTELLERFSALDHKEREVLTLYFGIGHENTFTLEDIGKRFGLTRERIRQIKERALAKLKQTVSGSTAHSGRRNRSDTVLENAAA